LSKKKEKHLAVAVRQTTPPAGGVLEEEDPTALNEARYSSLLDQ
jgi:hypothetical protein